MQTSLGLAEIAAHIGAELHGDGGVMVRGLSTLEDAGPDQLAFLTSAAYKRHLADTRAAAVILSEENRHDCPAPALVCKDPHLGYALAARLLYQEPEVRGGIHPSAVVDRSADIDSSAWIGQGAVIESGVIIAAGVFIGPGCVIGKDCVIGEGSRLVARVSLCHGTEVGCRALIHPGAVLGADGFSFARTAEGWLRIPQVGRVIVGDDVEIGANTTVDRGALKDTLVGDGVKLDNLIQIAHNVRLGKRTAIAACTGISGSSQIGDDCILAGQVGMAGHLKIGDGVFIAGGSNVTRDLKGPGSYGGMLPVDKDPKWRKNTARVRQLDEMARRIRQLEKALENRQAENGKSRSED